MEKTLSFTADQKNLIFHRFVQPQNGTKEESDQFIEICETFGLNPLLNDIVFQKFGSRVNFITTRDGLLRVATGQKGYVGAPNANVVREGDDFEFFPSKGEVHHKFGAKRGKIIGAYAVMKHATFNPVAVFVDFDEYYNANSGLKNSRSGKANVWDTMPSAMIVKVAEVFVLRRQFPLGGLYTYEEMNLEGEQFDNAPSQNLPNKNASVQNTPDFTNQNNQQSNTVPFDTSTNSGASIGSSGSSNVASSQDQAQNPQQGNQDNSSTETLSKQQIDQLLAIVQDIANVRNVPTETITGALGKPLVGMSVNEFESTKDKLFKWLEKAKEEASSVNNQENESRTEQDNGQQSNAGQPTNEGNPTMVHQYVLVRKQPDQTPGGVNIIRIFVQNREHPIFARSEEAIKQIAAINEGDSFVARTREINGFTFLEAIDTKHTNQTA